MSPSLSRRELLACVGAAALSGGRLSAADKQPRIKIGQIGIGHAHATKLSVYRQSPDYEVVGIVEPDKELRERAEQQAAFQGLPGISEKQLLETPGLKAVLVET